MRRVTHGMLVPDAKTFSTEGTEEEPLRGDPAFASRARPVLGLRVPFWDYCTVDQQISFRDAGLFHS